MIFLSSNRHCQSTKGNSSTVSNIRNSSTNIIIYSLTIRLLKTDKHLTHFYHKINTIDRPSTKSNKFRVVYHIISAASSI